MKELQIDDVEPVSKERNRRSALIEARERAGWQRQPQTALATDSEFKRARTRLSLPLAAASVMLIALAVALFYLWISSKPKQIETVGALKSIAVLPFKPLAADSRDQSLELGMANTLIDKLSASRQLIVRPLSEVRKYTKLEQDPLAAGRELRVDYVLEGYLQMAGENTRATVRLWSVKDGTTVWTDQCDQACSNIFELQDVIAERIAGALAMKLTSDERKQLDKHYTDSPQAYHLYSLGMLSSFPGGVREEREKAIEYFEEAIKLDPNYALAYCGLFAAYDDLGLRGFWSPKEARQKLEWAAKKAIEHDETLAEAHAALGQIMKDNWDWAGAEKEFKRALELDPNSMTATFLYNAFLVNDGRPKEALVWAKRREEIEGANSRGLEAFDYFHDHQYDKAIELYLEETKRGPKDAHGHFFLGEAYLAKEMYEQGIAEIQKAVALDNAPKRWDRYPVLAYAYAVSGKREEALKILDEQKRLEKHAYISPYNFAIIYTGLGDKDSAFEYLNKAYDEGVPALHHFPSRPMFEPLRSDPRNAELLRRMNLAPK